MLAIIITLFSITKVTAQQTYKELIGDNPTAEADMKVVGDFVKSLTSGDLNKAKALAAPNYIGRGPSQLDSASIEKSLATWEANYKVQSNRNVTFVTQTFRVLSGSLEGNWVSLWGNYTFTQAGKTITFPFQYTAKVVGGKILSDRIYYDRQYILTELGYKTSPPVTTR